MKTLYLTSNGANICIDPINNSAEWIDTEREAIQRIYLAKEPMHVIYTVPDYKKELDVDKDDIIITFYTKDFENRIVRVKNEDWVNNLKNWRAKEVDTKLSACEIPSCDECCKCA